MTERIRIGGVRERLTVELSHCKRRAALVIGLDPEGLTVYRHGYEDAVELRLDQAEARALGMLLLSAADVMVSK